MNESLCKRFESCQIYRCKHSVFFTANWRWSNLTKQGCTFIMFALLAIEFVFVFSPSASKRKYIWNTPCTYRRHYTFELCVLIMWLTLETETMQFSSNEMSKCQTRFEAESRIQSINIVLLATIFWRCTGSLFWRETASPLRKTKVQQKGMFSVNTQLLIHLPGTRRQCSTIWDRRESPMIWYPITFAVWFFPTIFAGTRYSAKSKKKMETVDELDPRILNHLEMYQTPQNHSDITSSSPRKMKQRSWRELKCCEISGYLDAQWSKSWLGGKRSSKWKKPPVDVVYGSFVMYNTIWPSCSRNMT